MERQNKKNREKAKREEVARITKLIEMAYKKDPRIAKQKQEEKEMKQKKKQEKFEVIKKEREEKERQAAEERKKKEDEAKAKEEEAAKKRENDQKEAKATRKQRTKLRGFCKNVTNISPESVEKLCSFLPLQRLQNLCKAFETDIETGTQAFNTELSAVSEDEIQKEKKNQEAREKQEKEESANKKDDWSIQELDTLHKGLTKYPAGIPNRWELIADLVKRPLKEVMAKAKELASKAPTKGDINLDHSAFDRYKATVAKKVETANQKLEESKYGTVMSTNYELSKEVTPTTNSPLPTNVPTAGPPLTKTPASTVNDWTAEQQKALEQGLKSTPTAPDRWDKIALLVPGKSKKDCIDRYNYLVAQVKSKKK